MNRWLAEQLHITPDRPSSPSSWLDGSRRSMASPGLTGSSTTNAAGRRPRVDPNALDWNRLSGEENVAVINRLTGKKVLESCLLTINIPFLPLGVLNWLLFLFSDHRKQGSSTETSSSMALG